MSIFDTGIRLSISDFFDEVMHEYGFSVDDLTPNGINKIFGFKLAYRALGVLSQFWVFQAFFNSSTKSGMLAFSQWRNTHAFIVNQKAH